MHARILTVDMGPGMRDEGFAMAERWFAAVATLPGFVDVTFFGDEERGVYGYFSLWETREAAEAAGEAVGPQLNEAIARQMVRPPQVRIFEVYRPRESSN